MEAQIINPKPDSVLGLLNKVPEVTIFFWIIKIMATTVGETGADFLIFNLHFGLTATSAIMGLLLLAILFVQIRTKRYIPWIYWMTVVMISIVGTLITDNLTDNFGVSLVVSTIAFSVALAVAFATWYSSEKTLSIHTIYTSKRELFYWVAILVTFALGTAAGDLASESLSFGYAISGLIFGVMIASIAFLHYVFKVNSVLTFWLAYILTRPFGASFGDYLSQPAENGGMGFGTVTTSVLFLAVIFGLVTFLSLKSRNY